MTATELCKRLKTWAAFQGLPKEMVSDLMEAERLLLNTEQALRITEEELKEERAANGQFGVGA